MAFTSGFFNSIDHDRKYDARQFSRFFDGIINDGIFMNIGDCFVVKAVTENNTATNKITVGTGRAWFDGTWSRNDSLYLIELPLANVGSKRIDAVVLETNNEDPVRSNSLKIVQGNPSSSPTNPTLINTEKIHQYPLCYITRTANNDTVTQSAIRNMVGSSQTPFVTGILKTVSLTELLGQWESELDEFVDKETLDFNTWSASMMDEFEKWMNDQKNDYDSWEADAKEDFDNMISNNSQVFLDWKAAMDAMFSEWFSEIQTELSGDVAGNLQLQINKEEIERILLAGFTGGTKTISEDGRNIVTVSTDGRTLTKTFNEDFSKLTIILAANGGGTIATLIKSFDKSGLVIDSEVTYT